MTIISEKGVWDKAVLAAHGAFFQSWVWGEFQKALGRKVKRIEGVGQFVRMPLPFGKYYWYCPRGPFLPLSKGEIKRGSLDLDGVFFRTEPQTLEQVSDGAIKAQDQQPSHTIELDLSKSDDELLAGMHEKTRYNIRLAERKGVEVRIVPSNDSVAKSAFIKLLAETASRDGFSLHPGSYYETLCESLTDIGNLVIATHEGDVLAVHFLVTFGDTTHYLFGASSSDKRNLMAPYLVQWKSALFAKSKGIHWYDFFGISDANPRWEGITRFKRGFGGVEVTYPGTFDIPLQKGWYKVYQMGRKLRRSM
ncbi:MAG: peptidoglycan bridge formation glycyltransferase FemA/FemB family protein [bacterium]|nr:peptidoglycan bridge formation glycyltransferase FemA/FemB family protein [bacterium]